MSGIESGTDTSGQAQLGVGNNISTTLMRLLTADDIQPGTAPSYETCKTIYAYHPLGAKLAEASIDMAQSQEREISIPGGPEEELIDAFQNEWNRTGSVGGNTLVKNVMTMSRVYGIASLMAISPDVDAEQPLPLDRLHEIELSYNVLDPLNTSGSLVLDQNPNSVDFQKPRHITAAGKAYHPSRAAIVLNEQPIYIEWTNSAFGFVGRSVYQRALYPLKSYIQSMISDNAVMEKAALLVAKMKAPGSIIDQRARSFFGFKRESIKGAKTGNVVSIGTDESIESVDLKNLRDAAEFARNNILKNIATAAKMPASLINQETLAEGFGEGSEDAKQIARHVDGIRTEAAPVYRFLDNIVMHRAWSPEFYESIQRKYPKDWGKVDYKTAFYAWKNAFKAVWPNLLAEPDSEKIKVDDTITKAAIAAVEVLVPILDPENKATLACWLADVLNSRDLMFSSPLTLDGQLIADYVPPVPMMEPDTERKPIAESSET